MNTASSARKFETISFEVRDHVAWVTMNRPKVLNAINGRMQIELSEAWHLVRLDAEIHVAVLTGVGERSFTTGVDRSGMDADPDELEGSMRISMRAKAQGKTPGGPGFESDMGERIGPKSQLCWKPVIAAINGIACGGAFYLLGEVDIIIAADHATFFDPHITYGAVASYESMHMLQRMPLGEVARMQLLGSAERMSAQRAYQIGLVSEVVPMAELHDAAHKIASTIAALSPSAVQGTLRAIWAAQDLPRPQALQLGPHFVAMADPQGWAAGQREYNAGARPKPRIR